METARSHLKDIIEHGILSNISEAEEALALYRSVSIHAKSINAATFGQFFGRLQDILRNHLFLALTRLFEEVRSYPIRSIPAAVKVLNEDAKDLLVEQRTALADIEISYGFLETTGAQPEITQVVSRYFGDRLRSLAPKVKSLRNHRDKFIAHSEAISAEDLPAIHTQDIHELLDFAKHFTHTIRLAYLSTPCAYVSGEYMLTSDAFRASVCLERLLEFAGCSALASKMDKE
jgi:hypothetical protein